MSKFHILSEVGLVGEMVENRLPVSQVEVLRTGTIFDRGLKITEQMLDDFVKHFNENVVGQEISVNKDHSDGVACGWLKNLYKEGTCLMATIEWTIEGTMLIKNDLYKYVSCEFFDKYPRSTDGKVMKNVFTGLALTNTPAMKNQKPLMLSEIKQYNLTNKTMFEKLLSELLKKEVVLDADLALAQTMLSELGEEEQLGYKEKMEALEAKMAKCKKEMEALEKEKAEMAKKGKKEEMADKSVANLLAEQTKLTEKMQLQEQELTQLRVEKRMTALSEKANKIVLSEKTQLGLPVAKKDDAVAFMATLSDEQVETFVSLMSDLAQFDAGVKGASVPSSDVSGEKTSLSAKEVEDKIAKINAEAEEMSKAKGIELAEAVRIVTEKYYL